MDRGKRERRGSREQTTTAILDAAEKLFAARGFTAVTVRDIAAEAGVSHALVHRYLGSKADVYRAMLVRNEDAIRSAASDEDDILAAASLMLREGLTHQRRYVRLVAHSALHGLSYDRTAGSFAATQRLVELAQNAVAAGEKTPVAGTTAPDRGVVDPKFVVASVVALFIGWIAAEDWILRAASLDDLSDDAIADSLEQVILGMLKDHIPGAGGAPSQ